MATIDAWKLCTEHQLKPLASVLHQMHQPISQPSNSRMYATPWITSCSRLQFTGHRPCFLHEFEAFDLTYQTLC